MHNEEHIIKPSSSSNTTFMENFSTALNQQVSDDPNLRQAYPIIKSNVKKNNAINSFQNAVNTTQRKLENVRLPEVDLNVPITIVEFKKAWEEEYEKAYEFEK